jgi:hypothetical protein
MAFVVARLAIALPCASVIRVRSRSYARKSSWKRAVVESEVEGLSVDWLRVSGWISFNERLSVEYDGSRVNS